jgi:F0F1-type ATP synthase assembly protein I
MIRSFIVGLVIMAGGGAVYGFSSYSTEIKSKLNWSQGNIEYVGEMLNVGTYIGPVTGMIVQIFRKSPYLNFLIAGICVGLGYFLSGIVLERNEGMNPSPLLLGFLLFLVGFGSGIFNITTLAVNVQNVSSSDRKYQKGIFISCLNGAFALGAIIFSYFHNWLDSTVLFLKYMGLIVFVISLLGCFLVKLDGNTYVNVEEEERVSINNAEADGNAFEFRDSVKERIIEVFRCIIRVGKVPAFWMIFLAFACGAGNGLMFSNNLGSLIESMNTEQAGKEEIKGFKLQCIIIYSISNALGRILMGLSDYSRFRRGIFLVLSLFSMVLSQVICAFTISSLVLFVMFLP